jgi:hypothetical protein
MVIFMPCTSTDDYYQSRQTDKKRKGRLEGFEASKQLAERHPRAGPQDSYPSCGDYGGSCPRRGRPCRPRCTVL